METTPRFSCSAARTKFDNAQVLRRERLAYSQSSADQHGNRFAARKRKHVTVCIAAACRKGEIVVTVTDGALSQCAETMDTTTAKMYWFKNEKESWQLLWAGEPSNTDLILENIREELLTDDKILTRERIQHTVKRA